MSGAIWTFVGTTDARNATASIKTSQGTVNQGQSGLFLSSELQSAQAGGVVLQQGPAQSPASLLSAPVLAAGASGGLNGQYRYCVTFVTVAGETTAGPESVITVVTQQVSLSSIPIGTALSGVTARKIYRTAAGGASGTQKLVTTFNDNTTTTFTDNVLDGALGVSAPVLDSSSVLISQSLDSFEDLTPASRTDAIQLIEREIAAGNGSGVSAVTSVFGRIGPITQQSGDYVVAQVTGAAPVASPAFSGHPTGVTEAPGTNNTRLSTTGYADAAVAVAAPQFQSLGNVGSTLTLNLQNRSRSVFVFVLTAATCTISVTNAVPGAIVDIYAYQDATGGRLITHPGAVVWVGGMAPILSVQASAPDHFVYAVIVAPSGVPSQAVGYSNVQIAGSPPGPVTPPIVTLEERLAARARLRQNES